jgi:phosphatidylserine/phosphatidylglycerophosphate/cardiolipin synthase-like enzyme
VNNKENHLLATLLLGIALLTTTLLALQAQAAPSTPSTPSLDVVVSEIAWMGTTTSYADEWIELYNNTDADVSLQGWHLAAGDGSPSIALQGTAPAGSHVLLERTNDDSAPPLADQTYTGNLDNGGEVITLTDGASTVVDVVGQPGEGWFAGDNGTKETMVRSALTATGAVSTSWTTGPTDGTPTNSILDGDGDTYGYSPNIDWVAGDGPGYALQAEDCDDSDADTHPGAEEVLDHKDNDCNGQVDDGLDLGPFEYATYFNGSTAAEASGKDYQMPAAGSSAVDEALVGFIEAATDTIDAAVYGLDRANVRDALIEAHDRNVTVRIVGDDEAAASSAYSPTYKALIDAGIPVVTDTYVSYIQHNKFAVFDGRTVWTGSTNWTDNGFTYNANNAIVITSTHLAQAYTKEFEEMFADGRFSHQKEDNTTHVFSYTHTLVEAYFSPSDNVEAQVAEVISNAQESLHFAMFYWTSDPLGSLVYTRVVTGGLEVSGVWDAVGAANAYSEDERLCAAGVPLKVETFGGKVHDKFAVVDAFGDDPVVILGSYNWTKAGAFDNDENTLIVHDAALAQAYYEEYQRLYEAIPDAAICGDHSAESGLAACRDGADNDYDGYVDGDDWDCRESTLAACTDGEDNDGDGDVDLDDLDCYRVRSVFLPLVVRGD